MTGEAVVWWARGLGVVDVVEGNSACFGLQETTRNVITRAGGISLVRDRSRASNGGRQISMQRV